MVPWGISATICPASNASAANRRGSSDPLARSTRIPPIALASCPTTGTSNTSFFPRKRAVRPLRAITSVIARASK